MQSDSWGHSDRFSTFQLRNLITIDLSTHCIQSQNIYIMIAHVMVYLFYSGLSTLTTSELII